VILGLLCSQFSSAKTEPGQTPVWSSDLRRFGYNDTVEKISSSEGVLFLDAKTIIVYFVIREPNTVLTSRDPKEGDTNFELHCVFLDAGTGQVVSEQQFPTRRFPAQIWRTNMGNILVRAGNSLKVYSPLAKVLHELHLSSMEPALAIWNTQMAPDGAILWLWGLESGSLMRLSADSLEVLETGTSEGIRSEPSDNTIMRIGSETTFVNGIRLVRDLLQIRTIGSQWRSIYELGQSGCGGVTRFVTSSTIIAGRCGSVELVSDTGQVLMHDQIDRHQAIENRVAVSPDIGSVAVSVIKTKVGFMDTGTIKRTKATLLLYDLRLLRRTATLDIKPVPQMNYEFGISSGGINVVVLSDSIVTQYSIGSKK
jgi:hypothetical protein